MYLNKFPLSILTIQSDTQGVLNLTLTTNNVKAYSKEINKLKYGKIKNL